MAKALVKILSAIIVLVVIAGAALILDNMEKQRQISEQAGSAEQAQAEKLPDYFGAGNPAAEERLPETLFFTAFMTGGKTQCGNFTCFEVQSMSGSGTIRPGDKISVKTDSEIPEHAAELLITGSFEGNVFVAESANAGGPLQGMAGEPQ